MIYLSSEKINKAKGLIDNGEYEEAIEYLNDLERKEALTLEERLNINGIRSYLFYWLGKFELALQTADVLYQTSQEFNKAIFSFDALHVKGMIFTIIGRWDEVLKNYELIVSLFKSIPQEDLLTYPQLEADINGIYSVRYFTLGKYDQSLEYADKCLAYYKKNDPLSFNIPRILNIKGWDHGFKGELNLALACCEKAIPLIPKSKYHIPFFRKAEVYRLMGLVYYEKGDFDRALEYLINSLEIFKKFEEGYWIATIYYYIIRNFLLKKENDEVQRYFHEFKLLKDKHESNPNINFFYQLTNALILKSSSRMRDRTEAEHILKYLIEEGRGLPPESEALIHLCDIYFQEFQFTNQMEILDDIHPLLNLLLQNARKTNSYYLLANGKLFQAKLALLQINMVKARKLLAEAQKIADENGLQLLAKAISREHDKLLEELKLWESFKKTQTSVAERLKLASIDDVLERLQGRGVLDAPDLENEEPVLLLIITTSGILLFSYPFSDDVKVEDELFGGFLSAITTFSGEALSEGLDRAKFGQYTILIENVAEFFFCYLFKGQTYVAQKKLTNFTENFQKNNSIMQALNKYNKTSQVIEL
ncbi:MAG: tetratricopeptide repeat protein [Promethearchaeota archaeon]